MNSLQYVMMIRAQCVIEAVVFVCDNFICGGVQTAVIGGPGE